MSTSFDDVTERTYTIDCRCNDLDLIRSTILCVQWINGDGRKGVNEGEKEKHTQTESEERSFPTPTNKGETSREDSNEREEMAFIPNSHQQN